MTEAKEVSVQIKSDSLTGVMALFADVMAIYAKLQFMNMDNDRRIVDGLEPAFTDDQIRDQIVKLEGKSLELKRLAVRVNNG